jgi:monoamine oxidase
MSEFHSDVIIIGAGAAGMAAARALSEHNLDIRVLEARDRIGGRIHTERPEHLHFPIELGAEYVHGCPPDLWNIVNEAGIRLNDTCVNHWASQDGALVMQTDYYSARAENGEDQSLQSFIDELLESEPDMADASAASLRFVQNYLAADPTKIGIKFLAQGENAAQSIGTEALQVIDGYDNIVRFLLKSCSALPQQLHLNTAVKSIKWQPGRVEVSTTCDGTSQTFTADRAIITLPLGVLKRTNKTTAEATAEETTGTTIITASESSTETEEGAVVFEPPLSSKHKAIENIQVGDVRRIVVIFKERFWEEFQLEEDEGFCEFGFITCQEAPISHWWSQYPVRSPILVGWVPREAASQLPHSPERLRNLVVRSLSIIFGFSERELGQLVQEIFQHDWSADPYARGAYSYRTPGGNGLAEELAQALEETLFFAGEATESTGFSGTVHGAIKTGLRAAQEVFATICEAQAAR